MAVTAQFAIIAGGVLNRLQDTQDFWARHLLRPEDADRPLEIRHIRRRSPDERTLSGLRGKKADVVGTGATAV
ncbi:hypothetical protein MGU_03661 [Metarhizium guizhouense ARSEF 977]|uniref:Uncharacterized protein n=1 Tax=Metarhizium guizhouense (strain ARSEF 977) TaxID=1276136 RepID=A0A0B4I8C3_METGA|nr:hypothetical protein MGU_03661 [Metarhizium guizhouense ARSEF 977]